MASSWHNGNIGDSTSSNVWPVCSASVVGMPPCCHVAGRLSLPVAKHSYGLMCAKCPTKVLHLMCRGCSHLRTAIVVVPLLTKCVEIFLSLCPFSSRPSEIGLWSRRCCWRLCFVVSLLVNGVIESYAVCIHACWPALL